MEWVSICSKPLENIADKSLEYFKASLLSQKSVILSSICNLPRVRLWRWTDEADPEKINAVADCPTPSFADALYVTKATPLPDFRPLMFPSFGPRKQGQASKRDSHLCSCSDQSDSFEKQDHQLWHSKHFCIILFYFSYLGENKNLVFNLILLNIYNLLVFTCILVKINNLDGQCWLSEKVTYLFHLFIPVGPQGDFCQSWVIIKSYNCTKSHK